MNQSKDRNIQVLSVTYIYCIVIIKLSLYVLSMAAMFSVFLLIVMLFLKISFFFFFKESSLNLIMSIYEKLTANIRLYGKILKAFPLMRNETKMPTATQHCAEVPARELKNTKKK